MYRLRYTPKRAAVLFKPVEDALAGLDLDLVVETMIVSKGPPSDYALVWEYGNVRQTKKGPKTTLARDVDTGKRVWLTIQAPSGYVRVFRSVFKVMLLEEIGKVKWTKKGTLNRNQLLKAMDRAGERIVEVIKENVPVDSGALRDSIDFVKSRDVKKMEALFAKVKGY